ncbi:MAG TPA: transcription-repair coupling factor [Burkholderiaceae bacterium]|nr:transcription-repair coupling factor [Burkholderiaceae bacterium]
MLPDPLGVALARPILRAGWRATVPRPSGSGDALLLAQTATQGRSEGRLTVLLCSDAIDAQRLASELPYFEPKLATCLFPDWETLPYDILSPHPDLVSERMETLYRLFCRCGPGQDAANAERIDVLVVAATTALGRLAPPQFLAGRTFVFRQGQSIDAERLRAQMVLAGYQAVSQVVAPGEFSVRGGLIDLFPTGSAIPYRLDLADITIDTIRAFDPDTQRSLYPVASIRLLPGREFPFDEAARAAFRGRWREFFEGDPSRSTVYRDVGNGIAAAGLEYYLPLFFERCSTLFDFLPGSTQIVTHGDVSAACRRFWTETAERYRFLSRDTQRPCLRPDQLFLTTEELFSAVKPFPRLAITTPDAASAPEANAAGAEMQGAETSATGVEALPELAVDRRAADPLHRLRAWRAHFAGRVLVTADTAGRRETIAQLLTDFGFPIVECADFAAFAEGQLSFALAVSPVQQGFCVPAAALAIVTEAELFASNPRRQRGRGRERASNVEAMVRDLAELRVGDPVVHAEHGIGRYRGLQTLDLGEGAAEFLHLEYAGDAKLYVPVAQLHLIGRYSGADPDAAPLHELGSGDWERARRKAARQVRDTAAELLNLYAMRAARRGHAFHYSDGDYQRFAEGFEFEETPDQHAAIDAVLQDMRAGCPMDRLVCGDVGFGKTEVALRAAFAAVSDGKQVAVLCPTTLLAEQHAQTFRDRFAAWPVRICELSRFRSARESAQAIAGLRAGTVDVVIGTHKLLSEDVRFDRLGLVIIDEEHRFGVRQKERLKALRTEVDVLTLTATPIPRTLAMSLEGIRDFSVIATAPQRRLAIKTFVRQESPALIREACLRELQRGGQIYFLYNEVETIENRRARLEQLLPEARISVAHGRMAERELEHIMRDFHQQRFNILLCTTIIETGIDVPNANTILIHRADRFGLAQLHQLRGRVGRSHHQAYAYLMIEEGAVTKTAEKRLEAIQNLEELGSGFYLAMHDLEIRGAGEVLGDSQSGNLQEVGFDMYSQMLNSAVRALRAGREPDLLQPLAATTEINLHVPALLPSDYVPDVHQRLSLYKKLATAADLETIVALQEEIVDRFGRLPAPARALVDTHRLRLDAQRIGVRRIDAGPGAMLLHFVERPPIELSRIVDLLKKESRVRLAGQDRLRIEPANADLEQRLQLLRAIFKELAP